MITGSFEFFLSYKLLQTELERLEKKKNSGEEKDISYITILENEIKKELALINKLSLLGIENISSVKEFEDLLNQKTHLVLMSDSQYIQFIKTSSLYKSMEQLVKEFKETE